MSIIVENAKSGNSICRLCDETMEDGKERLGAKMNVRYTSYCHPECFLKTFAVDKAPNNRGKCKLGCTKQLKKDETRVGFQFDPASTLWFHVGCCAKFVSTSVGKYPIKSIAGLADLDSGSQKEVGTHFPDAKSGPSLPPVKKPKSEKVTGSEEKATRKRTTRTSAKPLAKPKEDLGDEDQDAEPAEDEQETEGKREDDEVDEGDDDEGTGYGENDPDRETDFGTMTAAELRDECEKFGIKTWGLTKDKMIKALQTDIAKKDEGEKPSPSEKDWQPEAEDENKPAAKKQKTAKKAKGK